MKSEVNWMSGEGSARADVTILEKNLVTLVPYLRVPIKKHNCLDFKIYRFVWSSITDPSHNEVILHLIALQREQSLKAIRFSSKILFRSWSPRWKIKNLKLCTLLVALYTTPPVAKKVRSRIWVRSIAITVTRWSYTQIELGQYRITKTIWWSILQNSSYGSTEFLVCDKSYHRWSHILQQLEYSTNTYICIVTLRII